VFKSLIVSALVLNLGLLLGRLSGFVREAFVASTFGASAQADIVVLMLTVPDLLVNILVGGAFGAVLVPAFSRDIQRAGRLLYQSLVIFGLVFMLVSAGLFWQADFLVTILMPGFGSVQASQAALALGWVIWLVPLTVLAGVVTAYLHSRNQFAVAALGTLIINVAIVIGLSLSYFGNGSIQLVAIFVLIGGLVRLLSQLQQVTFFWNPVGALRPLLINKNLFIQYGQAMLSGSVLLLFPVVSRAFASYETEGSVALFNYASRLVEFPLAVSITFLTVVVFPRLANSYSSDLVLHRQLIRYGIQAIIGLSLVVAIILASLSSKYVVTVYGYGVMQKDSLEQVTALVKIGLLMLPLQGVSGFLTAVFNSRKDTRTPMLLNGIGLVFFISGVNIGLFGEGLPALMWGMLTGYGVICLLQLLFLKVDSFSWLQVFREGRFVLGIFSASMLSVYLCQLIERADFSSWGSMILGCVVGLVTIFIMALFYQEIRSGLKVMLIRND